MKFVDFHNHLFDLAKFESVSKYKNGDIFFVSVAGNKEELDFLLDLKYEKEWKNIAVCAAVHPINASAEKIDFVYNAAKKGLLNGIGETGLDYRKDYLEFKNIQKEMFERHIKIAEEFSLPIVIHSVRAMEDLFAFVPMMKLLKKVIFHSWAGSYSDAKFFLRNDVKALFSFNQQSFNGHKNSENSILNLDIENIVLETDFPWQSVKKDEYTMPGQIENLYIKMASIKGISINNMSSNMLKSLTKTFFSNNSLTTAL